MTELPQVRPKSRSAWRTWLQKNHASSRGVWLVYAKKHANLPSLSYNDAVEEALCFGWIDSKINPIDDGFYKQVFTPRKPKSAWSALNRGRVKRLLAAGLMTPAGLAVVEATQKSGAWTARTQMEELTLPPDLEDAIQASPEARHNWPMYSASLRRGFLYRLAGAKRPQTRAKYLHDIVQIVALNVSRTELMERSGFRQKPRSVRRAKP